MRMFGCGVPGVRKVAQVQRTEFSGKHTTGRRVDIEFVRKLEAEMSEAGKMAKKVVVQLVTIKLKVKNGRKKKKAIRKLGTIQN